MKIVVLDGYTENPGELNWEKLEKLGELTVYDRTSVTDENEIISRIGDAEVVITNKTPITSHRDKIFRKAERTVDGTRLSNTPYGI